MIRRSVIFSLLAFIGLSFFLHGCDTEVDLLAPYKSTPVIIGILDYSVDTQFVRINRTYLGAGDANNYAQIKDSVEYNPSEVEAKLYKKRDGVIQDSIKLEYIVKPSRDPGVFYDQNIGFYYTAEPLFTAAEKIDIRNVPIVANPVKMTYVLKVVARGKTYTAETDFSSFTASSIAGSPNPNTTPKLQLYTPGFNTYQNYSFNFSEDYTSARYTGVFRINYDYNTTDGGVVTNQFTDFGIGKIDNSELTSNSGVMLLTSENWYKFIGNKLRAIPNLKKVRIDHLELRITTANKDLNTYYKIANPVSDFTPVLSTFSNFDNGAIGILGSRITGVKKYFLSDPSMQIMNEGNFTIGPCYCNKDWPGSNYVCTATGDNCP